MPVRGVLTLDAANVAVPRVTVEFNPDRLAGTLSFVGRKVIRQGDVATLVLDDGTSLQIGIGSISSEGVPFDDTAKLTVSAPFHVR